MVKVAPRRDEHSTGWLWQTGVANDLEQSQGQSTARGISSDDDVTRFDRTMGGSFWRPDEEEV